MTDRNEIPQNGYYHNLVEHGFVVKRGFDKELARRLVARSRQDEIRAAEPRDSSERFHSIKSTEAWYREKSRALYSLDNVAVQALAGVIWLNHSPDYSIPGSKYTFNMRIYEPWRTADAEHGSDAGISDIAHQFGEAVLYSFERTYAYYEDIGLEIDRDEPLIDPDVYERLHFEQVGLTETSRIMLRPGSAKRAEKFHQSPPVLDREKFGIHGDPQLGD